LKPRIKQDGALQLVLDWQAYFHEFCREHGEPVLWRGRLLFRDGWTYSSTSYRGPEWPPPESAAECAALVTAFHKVRLAFLRVEHRTHSELLAELRRMQGARHVPLQHKTVIVDDEGRKRVVRAALSLREFEGRVEWLERDIAECEAALKEVSDAAKQRKSVPDVRGDGRDGGESVARDDAQLERSVLVSEDALPGSARPEA
jgi:hypothetical protein